MSEEAKSFNFPEEVRAAFEFLIEKYGFRNVASTSRKVRYESNTVFIEIGYGSYDCEVAIRILVTLTELKARGALFSKLGP
jgi:hypothetical protein